MPRKTNNKILKEHLILCEGRDEQEFLIQFLESDTLSFLPGFSNDIQVMDFGGNSELLKHLTILKKMDGFEKIKSLLVVRDAETNAETACKEIQVALQRNDLPVLETPCCWKGETLRVGFVLFPQCDSTLRNGTLEDLCLSILSDTSADNTLKHIDKFLANLEEYRGKPFSRIFKAKLHTYFSVHNDYVSLKIGEAAKAGAFDWNNVALNPLKNFIQEIL